MDMKVKRLVIVIMVMAVVLILAFSYFFLRGQAPTDAIAGITAPDNQVPKFLYAINSEPAHPFEYPVAAAVINKNIYVSDVQRGQVSVFDYSGKFIKYLVPGREKFVYPYGITFDGKNVYVADGGTRRIYLFDSSGRFIKIFPEQVELSGPGPLYYSNGKLYVIDQPKHHVLCFDTAGKLLQTIGKEGHGKGELYFPHAITVDKEGLVYVADAGNDRIEVFNKDGSFKQTIGNNLMTPRGLAQDGSGNLWVVAGMSNKVQVYKPDGKKIVEFGKYGADYGMLSLPNGIFVDGNKRIYVTEFGNSRVSVFGY